MTIPRNMHVPVFAGEGRLEFVDRAVPHPAAPDDVLIAVRACGICGTDLNILAVPPAHKARPGIILGHEGLGEVVEAGPAVRGLVPGDRVVIAPRLSCGRCRYCRRGLSNQCEDYTSVGTSIDGAFAPYLRLPDRALFKVPAGVTDEDALLFEPLSCVVGAVARVSFRPGDRVAIIGAGPMGLLFALVYRAMGAAVIIMADVSLYRLAAAEQAGADLTVNPKATSLADAVRGATEIGCDIVVDAVGNQLPVAVELTRRAGQILLFGLRPEDRPAVSQYTITRHDLTVTGAFVGLYPFEQTLQLLAGGVVHPGRLITHRLPLAQVSEGVTLMRSAQAVKVAIETQ